nr:MAG TPA_asm: hypothetical protein [Caudoviricetes sp.]
MTNTSLPFIVYAVQKFLQVINYLQFLFAIKYAYCLMCCKVCLPLTLQHFLLYK